MDTTKTFTLFLLLTCMTVTPVLAQPQYRITSFSTTDGLPQRTVSDLLQDQRGYMWFSTWNGLARFDAYSFVTYNKSADDPTTPRNNRINYIRENSQGDIWCSTNDKRAYLFDVRTENYIDILQPIEEEMKRNFEVTAIYPLAKGATWLVCGDGTCFRIDDKAYKKEEGIRAYTTFDNSLKGEIIYTIMQDQEGDEWVMTNKGASVIGHKHLYDEIPFVYYGYHENDILLITASGIMACYHIPEKQLTYLDVPTYMKNVKRFWDTGNGIFCFLCDKGLVVYDHKRNTFDLLPIQTEQQILSDSQGYLWIIPQGPGMIQYDPRTGQTKHLFLRSEGIIKRQQHFVSAFEDSNHTFWAITDKGVFVFYDRFPDCFLQTAADADILKLNRDGLWGQYYVDNQDNLWFPTVSGVSKVTFAKEKIRYQELDRDFETRACMLDKEDNLWVGNKAGKIRIYTAGEQGCRFLTKEGRLVATPATFTESGVYTFTEDSSGRIWIGTKGQGLYLLTPTGRQDKTYEVSNYRHNPEHPESISSNEVYSIYEDSRQRIWAGCYTNGLNLIHEHPERGIEFINYNNLLKNYPISDFSSIRHIEGTPEGILLIGTTNGLLTFSEDFTKPETIRFYKNQSTGHREHRLSGNNVMHILCHGEEDIYITTFDGGIHKARRDNLLSDSIAFSKLTGHNSEALPALPQAIIRDKEEYLWIVSEDNLTRYDPRENTFQVFSRSSLMHNYYFSEAIPSLDSKGNIVIGTEGGMIIVNPYQMLKDDYIPPVVFTEIHIQGRSAAQLNYMKELVITPSQRNIAFQFACLDYINSGEIRYAYRMKGIESDWSYRGTNRSVSYVNLPKGEYKFQVRSTNSNGIWVDNIQEVSVKVLPRFRETAWSWLVWIGCIFLIIALSVYVILYIYRLRYQIDFEQQLAHIKLRFFTDISHELRTPLTLITGPVTEVLEQEELSPAGREYLNVVKSNIDRMQLLINQILDFRKIQNKKMKLLVEYTDISFLLQKMQNDFHLIANKKEIDFRLEGVDNQILCWVDRDKFEKIFFNLLSNAFKFTDPGKSITLKVAEEEDRIAISVTDRGMGISKEKIATLFERFESYSAYDAMQPSSGIGLSMVRELSLMHHAEIEVNSREGEGSEFRIIFRKGDSHFKEDPYVEFIVNDDVHYTEEQSAPVLPGQTSGDNNVEERLTLLIVEDNPELSRFLSSILSRSYQVIEAANGKEGLEKAIREMPDFILTDVVMPVMDGLDMVKAIKETPAICHTPILVLSSQSSLDDRIKGLEHGIDDYITKPFSSTYLKTRIASLMERRRQLQEKYMSELSLYKQPTRDIVPARPEIVPSDQLFIQKLMEFMEANMDNAEIGVEEIAAAMDHSYSIFYRKLKSILGLSPVDFIREIRIKRAAQLIESGEFTFSQVAYMTGFNDSNYFGKCFKKYFGMSPSEYKSQQSAEKNEK